LLGKQDSNHSVHYASPYHSEVARSSTSKLARRGVSWHLKITVCIFPNFKAAAEKVENSFTRALELRFEEADGSIVG
jgi:hypothetical protein